jgi:hypothetical protein
MLAIKNSSLPLVVDQEQVAGTGEAEGGGDYPHDKYPLSVTLHDYLFSDMSLCRIAQYSSSSDYLD